MQNGTTLRQFLTQALKLINVTPEGQNPSSYQLDDAKYMLNLIKDSWSTDGKMIYTMTTLVAPLANGVAQPDGTSIFTIGPGTECTPVSINVAARPQYIEFAAFRQTSVFPVVDIPISILDADEWGLIRTKNIQTNISTFLYMDEQWPVANIHLWPQPNMAGSIYLVYWQGFGASSSLDDVIQLPPGYERALLLDTAISVAPSFGKEASPTYVSQLAAIKREIAWTNIRTSRVQYPGESQGVQSRGGAYDVFSDQIL
jgi:hypothetical protein